MFVLNPDPYSLPCYRIGPFQTSDLAKNHLLPESNLIDDYSKERFGNKEFIYTENGRKAINIALSFYNLKKNDVVTILTTSGNFYISSCVTTEIEKFCKWSRDIVDETKVILVNHEFGSIYPEMDNLVSLGIPVIEDCCTTFFSQNSEGKVGNYGDFAIFSFPKFFPVQIGGLLVNNQGVELKYTPIKTETKAYIQKVISHYISSKNELLSRRRAIFEYGRDCFKKLGFYERFKDDNLVVPSVMMLRNNGIIKDLPALKTTLWAHGIQSSIFYGEDAFFIPSHQNLTETDIDYFVSVINSAL